MRAASVPARSANESFWRRDEINCFVIRAAKCGSPHGSGEKGGRYERWITLRMANLSCGKRRPNPKRVEEDHMSRRHGKDRGLVFKNGLWWVRLYVNGREKWYRADSKTQAKTLYGRLKADVREGRYFPEKYDASKALTLRAWITRYLEGVTSRGLRNMHQYSRFWKKLLGRKLLVEISADELRHIQAKMKAKANRGPHTINRYFAALRHILNLAIAESYLVTNPVKGVRFFPEPTGRLKFLTEAEIARLREYLSPQHWAVVAFSLETGLRLSEQFHARWDCLNTEQGILTIPLSKSGKTRHGRFQVPSAKSAA